MSFNAVRAYSAATIAWRYCLPVGVETLPLLLLVTHAQRVFMQPISAAFLGAHLFVSLFVLLTGCSFILIKL